MSIQAVLQPSPWSSLFRVMHIVQQYTVQRLCGIRQFIGKGTFPCQRKATQYPHFVLFASPELQFAADADTAVLVEHMRDVSSSFEGPQYTVVKLGFLNTGRKVSLGRILHATFCSQYMRDSFCFYLFYPKRGKFFCLLMN